MPKTSPDRKARFRAALALCDMTADEWAKANGITPSHLSQVLRGLRDSKSLIAKIDAFARQVRAPRSV